MHNSNRSGALVQNAIVIIAAGMLWGLVELFGYALPGPLAFYKSLILTGIAMAILLATRRLTLLHGAAILIALIAIAYKSAGSTFYPCMAAAVLALAICFDIGYWIFGNKVQNFYQHLVCNAGIIYVAFIAFSVFETYIVRHPYWADTGLNRIIPYVTFKGSLAIAIATPLTYVVSRLHLNAARLTAPAVWVGGAVTTLCLVCLVFRLA